MTAILPPSRPIASLLVCACLICFPASAGFADGIPAQSGSDNISVTTSGIYPTAAGALKIPLPDIVITENWVGALRPEGFVAIAAPFEQIASFDVSAATLRAYRISDNVEITWAVIGGNKLIADSPPPACGVSNAQDVVFKLASASTAYTGPARLVISGLRASLAETATNGDLVLTIGGAETSGSGLDTLQKIDGSLGSGAAKKTLKVGMIVSNFGCQNCLGINVTGPISSQKISVERPWQMLSINDRCKQVSVFVAASFPSGSPLPGIYFLNGTGIWVQFSSCDTAPAYFTGGFEQLVNYEIPVVPVPSDLSAFIDTALYMGYGIPGNMTACENMLYEGKYSLVLWVNK